MSSPLREHVEDLPVIAHFVTEIEADLGRSVLVHPDAFARAAARLAGALSALHALLRAVLGPERSPRRVSSRTRRTGTRGGITIPRGDYASMKLALLRALVANTGPFESRLAIGVPSTLERGCAPMARPCAAPSRAASPLPRDSLAWASPAARAPRTSDGLNLQDPSRNDMSFELPARQDRSSP